MTTIFIFLERVVGIVTLVFHYVELLEWPPADTKRLKGEAGFKSKKRHQEPP